MKSHSVVGSTSVTDVSTCGTTSLNVEVESNGASGTWSNDFIGVFDNSTDASTVFQSNTFNEDMTLTWTNTSGGCSGSTTTITARFNQPSATGSMDTDSCDLGRINEFCLVKWFELVQVGRI